MSIDQGGTEAILELHPLATNRLPSLTAISVLPTTYRGPRSVTSLSPLDPSAFSGIFEGSGIGGGLQSVLNAANTRSGNVGEKNNVLYRGHIQMSTQQRSYKAALVGNFLSLTFHGMR